MNKAVRLTLWCLLVALCGAAETPGALLSRAGNADTDVERLAALDELQQLPGLDVRIQEDARKLIIEVRRWLADARTDYFSNIVRKTQDYDFGIDEDSPLFPITRLYRARMLCWVTIEYGDLWNDAEKRREQFDLIRALLEQYTKDFPENRLARMYLGEAWPAETAYASSPDAPAWANAQREALARLSDILWWWIDNRVREDGQYGGGWGDDCEMWRIWAPVLIGFDDPKITAAQSAFSRALLSQPHMAAGYTSKMSDVEHTAEDSADALTPMMYLEPESQEWAGWALRLADLFERKWSGINERGGLQFKSIYFTSETVDENPYRAHDTVYHPRALQPCLLYWQRTGDTRVRALICPWMDTWVAATARAESGKPAGIVPVGIHWPDGSVSGPDAPWWNAQHNAANPLYRWPSAMDLILNSLLLTHFMTDEPAYLEPIRSMAASRMRYLEGKLAGEDEAGTEAWCARELGLLSGVLGKYRIMTNDTAFDALLARDASSYMRLRMSGDRSAFTKSMLAVAQALSINMPGYTSEVRYTDRVLRFPTVFGPNGIYENGVPGIGVPDVGALYSAATGDPGTPQICPVAAVRWRTPAREIAALVTDSGKTRFAAELFHFGAAPRPMSADFYLLSQGNYTWHLDWEGGAQSGKLDVSGPVTQLAFTLPAGRLCVLRVEAA